MRDFFWLIHRTEKDFSRCYKADLEKTHEQNFSYSSLDFTCLIDLATFEPLVVWD